jgi:DNA-binding GntR family transcriptional regulator
MNAGPTSARVYEALRQRLMDRAWVPGTKLDPPTLAEEMLSSTTPVRDALHMLAGEDLVVIHPQGGFACVTINEPGLVDLYAWNGEVLNLALRKHNAGPPVAHATATGDSPEHLAERTALLFQSIADSSSNVEHAAAIKRINARLHGARQVEAMVLSHVRQELDAIELCHANRDLENLRRGLARYERRRKLHAAGVVRGLYRGIASDGT